MNRYLSLRTVITVGIVLLVSLQLEASVYNRRSLGRPYILDMNEKGEAIRHSSGSIRSMLFLPSPAYGLTEGFHELPGPEGTSLVQLKALNDSGVVVGIASGGPNGIVQLVTWTNGLPTGIGPADTPAYIPRGINNHGHIFGQTTRFFVPDTNLLVSQFGFFYDGSQFLKLVGDNISTCRNLIGNPFAINNSDAIVGTWLCGPIAGGPSEFDTYLWQGDIPTKLQLPEIRDLVDINNLGQMLGYTKGGDLVLIGGGSVSVLPKPLDAIVDRTHSYINDLGEVAITMIVGRAPGVPGKTMGFLWLPNDNYGLPAGLNDLTTALELPNQRVSNVYDLNNSGQLAVQIVFEFNNSSSSYILTPIPPPGLIVNSTSDESDINPGDSMCATSTGDCTLRAAIEESNALAGRDTISFNIPGGGIPAIQPATPLPSITDTVLIDGLSQFGSGLVELDGSLAVSDGSGVDGLTLNADESEIRGLNIHSFSASGIHITSGSSRFPNVNTIHSNIIGTDTSGLVKKPNHLHGIHASGSFIQIGRDGFFSPEKGNTIAFNLGSGVFVDSGLTNVHISENSIYGNEQLGIDLFPPGVNRGDSLAEIIGSNRQAKAPILFSIGNDFFKGRLLRGTFSGRLGEDYRIELFVNDTCDNSGSGEGRTLLTSLPGFQGGKIFEIAINSVDTSKLITATVTDDFGNTSEFSPCWPQKRLKLLDGKGDSLTNKRFVFSRVASDIPTFSDTLVDTLMTNDSGFIDVSKYYWGVHGDTLGGFTRIRMSQTLSAEPSDKHPTLAAYRVTLDNAKFDSLGAMSYARLNPDAIQEVTMDHTTLVFNLMVSIEWDADPLYIASLEQGFRNMSNYLYDVSDGQMRLDTVMIFDSKKNWKKSDIRINASNLVWPHVNEIFGIRRSGLRGDPIEMPRKWFGSETKTRNGTFDEHPLDMTAPKSFTTFAHEFGHYALSLFDEYIFAVGETRCGDRPQFVKPYGFMDYQYPNGGVYSSELSSDSAYSEPACQNNMHWDTFRQSTWETVELIFQKKYGGILASILRPSERTLPTGLDYLPGPNDMSGSLDYDVGVLVRFPITHGASSARSLKVRFFREANPSSAVISNMLVSLDDTTTDQRAGTIDQGRTSDDGGLWAIGKLPGHQILASGYSQILAISRGRVASRGRTWLYSGITSEFEDSVVIGLREVAGDKSVISQVQLGAMGLTYGLDAPNLFQSAPTIEHQPGGAAGAGYTFLSEAGGYVVSIPDSLSSFGTFRLSAVDDSGATYFFDAQYTTVAVDSGVVTNLKGPRGVSETQLDNTNGSLEKALLLSTDYPVLRAGLNPLSVQGGPAQDIEVFPEAPLSGDNSVTIRYSDADVTGGGAFGLEESLRIFHWDETSRQWESVGGSVDTFFNEVTASITSTGVYAAFTTDIQTDVGDDEVVPLPKNFILKQNYPNPFNPTTMIEYSIPTKADVTIAIYNILGQKVKVFDRGLQSAGQYSVTWDATDEQGKAVASGMYFYKITAGEFTSSKKMVLLK